MPCVASPRRYNTRASAEHWTVSPLFHLTLLDRTTALEAQMLTEMLAKAAYEQKQAVT